MASTKSSPHSGRQSKSHDRTSVRFSLEVCSGQTRFPNRPLPDGRLSIGSGSKCWLQLGGQNMPEIHSWFEVGRKEVALYVFEEVPSVQVNGTKVQFSLLKGGEIIQIGPFEFILHAQELVGTPQHFGAPHLSSQQLKNLQRELENAEEELSASELIDLLNEEMQTVERHETSERAGMMRLLEAVQAQQKELPPPAPSEDEDWKVCLTKLDSISQSLEERSNSLKDQESQQAETNAKFLEMQERMISQMDMLIAALDRIEEVPLRKASA